MCFIILLIISDQIDPPYFQHRTFNTARFNSIRERDLKGIVDGVKYTNEKPRSIPCLISKIEFIKKNLARWNLDKIKDLNIKEMVITRSYPPLKEYKTINFISIEQIKKIGDNS